MVVQFRHTYRYTKGKAVASDLVNNLKGSGMIHVFHTSFIAEIEKLVQKSRGTMTKSRKINSMTIIIVIQKSMTSFDLHGLMRPGLIKVTYVHPPLVPHNLCHLRPCVGVGLINFE